MLLLTWLVHRVGCNASQALRHGRVLVLDEADKAPLEVTAVLKSLLSDGQMLLSDGRHVE